MHDDDDSSEYMYVTEVELEHGFSVWGMAAIVLKGAGEMAETVQSVCENMAVELVYRHNTTVDQANFITTIKAGLDKL
jgi:hypothetical protein